MVLLKLDITKSLEKNAEDYFERAKKAKSKAEGAVNALEETKKKLLVIEKKIRDEKEKQARESERAKQHLEEKQEAKKSQKWYHKFRWFVSSNGLLVVGGRDATQNEILMKKHADKNDIVLHTDMAGSPFFVIKAEIKAQEAGDSKAQEAEDKEVPKQTLLETADAVCTYSKAWKLGMSTTNVFYVKPEQVTKEAPSGEYIKKGSFIIRGKTSYIENKINLCIGLDAIDKGIIAGPESAVKAHSAAYIYVRPGREKTSETAKKIARLLFKDARIPATAIDDIIKAIPAGGCEVDKRK